MPVGLFLYRVWLVLFFAINTAILGLFSLLFSLFSAKASRWFARLWGKANCWAAGIKIKIQGIENLPKNEQGFIIASNHASAADIGAVLAGIPADVCWVAKDSLRKVPFVGWHLKRVHILVARGKTGTAAKLLEAGVKRIKNGACVVIFPEGTRNRTNQILQPFKVGAFLLAEAAGQPIVPLAIVNSSKVWGTGQWLPKPGTITLKLGEPINPLETKEPRLQNLTEQTHEKVLKLLN